MRKTLLLALALLLSATWLAARSMPSPDNQPSKAGEKTIRGCLNETSGSFTLTDKDGTQWVVAGDGLSDHVGQRVSLSGVQNEPAVTSSVTGTKTTDTDSGEEPTFQVNSISQLPGPCKKGTDMK